MSRALTRDEAVARRRLLSVGAYQVELDLAGAADAGTFSSTVSVDFTCTEPGASTWLELKAAELVSAELNGRPLAVGAWHDDRLALDDLRDTNHLTVTARMAYSRTGEGLHRYTDPEDGEVYLYSQAFLDDAPRLFACFDQPDLKATFTLGVTAPPSWTVLSNTAGERNDSGRWQFATTQPISTYLVAVVAGPYHGVRGHHDGIDLGVWCRQSMAPHLDAERLLATTAVGFDYFHELFGVRYPFGKYDQAFVPEFNAGAMENPGLVTFRDEHYLPRGTVTADDRENLVNTQLHEMAHMWFGDLVTMRWWDDLWLNESFAEYMAYRAAAEAGGQADSWTAFLVKRKAWGYRADQLSSTHPVAGEAADTGAALLNFDGISYAKGASALRQLVEWVGDDAFLTGLRRHFADHAFDNASLADLVDALTTASGRDVSTWADQWLRTSGPSTLSLTVSDDGEGHYAQVAVRQDAPQRLRPHRMAIGLFDLDGDALVRRSAVAADVAADTDSPVPALTGEPVADLLLPNDGDLTYALVDLDDASLLTVREHLAGLTDPLARALVWLIVSEMVSRGTFAPSAFVELTTRALGPRDPQPVTARVVRDAITAADLWAPTEQRAPLLSVLAEALLHLAHGATPGSDQQLEHVRGLVEITHDADLLRGWLAADAVPQGVAVDDDLRWRLLHRAATLGAASDADIAAERERDRSSSGALHALTARAALPTPQAKERAWTSAVEGRLSNHQLLAVATGFWSADQRELLAPYVDRFAADYPGYAAARSAEMVQLFGRGLFPRTVVEPSTVDMADRVLAEATLPLPRGGRWSTGATRCCAACAPGRPRSRSGRRGATARGAGSSARRSRSRPHAGARRRRRPRGASATPPPASSRRRTGWGSSRWSRRQDDVLSVGVDVAPGPGLAHGSTLRCREVEQRGDGAPGAHGAVAQHLGLRRAQPGLAQTGRRAQVGVGARHHQLGVVQQAGLQLGHGVGRQRRGQERHVHLLGVGERQLVDDVAQLLGDRTMTGTSNRSASAAPAPTSSAARRAAVGRRADHVAARDVGADVGEPEVSAERPQVGHGHLVARPEVDAAQQRDPRRHWPSARS